MKKSSFKKSLAMFLAILMLITSVPILAFATTESGVKPADGTTQGQPFVKNDPSEIFRIPCMVTLDDGTIVAAADARWNGGMDGGGNDTIVARSTDGGINWDYTMTNYYPDNGNVFNMASTSVCDSELVTDGKNVYMLTVFFPAGYALNNKSANNQLKSNNGTAFDDQGRVKLAQGTSSNYAYYLGEFNQAGPDGRAPIMNNDGSETGYYADHDYYIYNGTSKTGGNLFYSDGEFQTAKVNFLLFRKSTDGGATWSDFTPVPAKNSSEAFFGVGPGRGIYDAAHNRLIFSTYTWNGSNNSQRSSFIYSDDEGKTWHRSPDFPKISGAFNGNWSSESTLVQLDDNRLRCFVRNGWKRMEYADAVWNETTQSYSWPDGYKDLYLQINGTPETLDVGSDSGCMLSALKYSEKLQYNGNYYTAIFISTPRQSRAGGVIYTVLLDDDYNVVNIDSSKKDNDKQIMYTLTTDGIYFGYSCLVEHPDGSLGILYEINGARDLKYETLDATKVSGCRLPDYVGKTYHVDLNKGDLRTFYVDTDQVTMYDTDDPANTSPEYLSTSFKTRKGANIRLGDSSEYTGATIDAKNALYDFTRNADGTWNLYSQGVNLTVVKPGLPSSATKGTLRIVKDGDYFQFIAGGTKALYYWRSGEKINQFDQTTAFGLNGDGYTSTAAGDQAGCRFDIFRPMTVDETASSAEVPGYVKIKSMDELVSGNQYLIGCQTDNGYYLVYPSMSTTNTYSHSAKVSGENNTGFFMSVNAQLKGSTTIVVGKDTYIINVSDFTNEILGVVEYDPVIYTHGGTPSDEMSHTYVGQFISDGTWEGEKETHFSIRPAAKGQYTVESIQALSAPDSNGNLNAIQNADITFDFDEANNDGIIHGTLPLCNDGNYTSYKKGEYVTLKTVVRDNEGNSYTQTDRLYVASNPVAGHVVLSQAINSGNNGSNAITYLLANNSYGNTVDDKGSFGVGYKFNAKRMYSSYFNGGNTKNTSTPLQYGDGGDWKYSGFLQADDSSGIKRAGAADISSSGTYGKADRCVNYGETNSDPTSSATPIAYYYYDVSDVENSQGIVNPTKTVNSDQSVNSTFSIQFSRMAADANGQGSGFTNKILIDYGEQKGKNWVGTWGKGDYWYSKDSVVKQLAAANGATLTEVSQPFGKSGDTYTYQDFANQQKTINVNCKVSSMAKNSVGSLKGVVVYTEMYQAGNKSPRLNMNLPFEILICNKQEQRDAYDDTVKSVLKSTSFTTSTWKNYLDSALAYEEYLNNYTLRTPDEKVEGGKSLNEKIATLGDAAANYDDIQKSADFIGLKKEIDNGTAIYEQGIEITPETNYTPSSFTEFESAYETADNFYEVSGQDYNIILNSPMGQLYDRNNPDDIATILKIYGGDGIRSETPGYEPGINNNTKLPVQNTIEKDTEDLASANSGLQIAADDSAYVAVKELYSRIDKTAYTDNAKTIDDVFTNYDDPSGYENGKIYLEYKGKAYVDVPNTVATEENPIDRAVAEALTEMTVGHIKDNDNNVKSYNVTINVNGEEAHNNNYPYGKMIYFPFGDYFTKANLDVANLNVECHATSYREDENGIKIPTETTVNLGYYASNGYNVPILIQNDIVINVTTSEKSVKQATIVDYYGTVIGTLTGETVTVDTATQTVTDGIQTIKAKNSPKYSFTGWSLADDTYPITEGMVISQVGTLIPGACIINANGGTVNTLDVFNSNQLNLKLTLAANNPNAIWTRTVDGKETLASYEANFVNFSSGADVLYKAYDNIDALPTELKTLAESNTPAINGVGYYANGKFTLSVDYSAPVVRVKGDKGNDTDELVVNVLDAGIIFTTTNPENLYKGGEGTTTYAAPRIAHWSSDSVNAKNSGTFTMSTSKNIDGAYMRAYVSYTLPYGKGTTLPYVAYSDTVYKCEKQADGSYKVTAVKEDN